MYYPKPHALFPRLSLRCLALVVLSLFLCGLFAGPGWGEESDVRVFIKPSKDVIKVNDDFDVIINAEYKGRSFVEIRSVDLNGVILKGITLHDTLSLFWMTSEWHHKVSFHAPAVPGKYMCVFEGKTYDGETAKFTIPIDVISASDSVEPISTNSFSIVPIKLSDSIIFVGGVSGISYSSRGWPFPTTIASANTGMYGVGYYHAIAPSLGILYGMDKADFNEKNWHVLMSSISIVFHGPFVSYGNKVLMYIYGGVGLGYLSTNAEIDNVEQTSLGIIFPIGFKIPLGETSNIGLGTKLCIAARGDTMSSIDYTGIFYELFL